ncbi:hypothetical protein DFS34DRAFT_140126 [Phlyctochytrium arcticum]|nr:hypothetical protein DFS34DRAFT_140126 [Phlyctochytrium arcticum]
MTSTGPIVGRYQPLGVSLGSSPVIERNAVNCARCCAILGRVQDLNSEFVRTMAAASTSDDILETTYGFQNRQKYSLKDMVGKFPLPSKKRIARAAFVDHFRKSVVEDDKIAHFALKRLRQSDLTWVASASSSNNADILLERVWVEQNCRH